MATSFSWLQKQRKGDLMDLADSIGLEDYDGLKKVELEIALDTYMTANAAQLRNNSACAGYFSGGRRGTASPVKREFDPERSVRSVRRRTIVPAQEEDAPTDDLQLQARTAAFASIARDVDDELALVHTPTRNLAVERFNLPATPAMLAQAVENTSLAIHERVSSLFEEAGVQEKSDILRSAMSTIHSILLLIAATELIQIRAAVLPAKHAFTVPPVSWLGLSHEVPINLPDIFLILTSSFWSPVLTWTMTSYVIPTLLGYFFNLTSGRVVVDREGNKVVKPPHYIIDPLTFSVTKAILSYVVYGQGVTFDGWLNPDSIRRLRESLLGGTSGILVGTSVTALMSIYDAILRK